MAPGGSALIWPVFKGPAIIWAPCTNRGISGSAEGHRLACWDHGGGMGKMWDGVQEVWCADVQGVNLDILIKNIFALSLKSSV